MAESVRSLGTHPAMKPVESDGKITTVIGRLTPDEFRSARKAHEIDDDGNLFVKRSSEKQKSIRNRGGRMSRLTVPVTLEEYRAIEVEHQRAEELARQRHAERAALQPAPRERAPASSSVLRFNPRPDWRLPETRALRDDDDNYEDDDERGLDDDLLEPADGIESDDVGYDYYAVAEPTDAEEDRAWEALYGLPAGHFAAEERRRRAATVADLEQQHAREEADRLALEWRADIEQRRADGDSRFATDARERCQNPNACEQPVKGRGTRCSACYKYRSEHRGEERPARLMNRQRRRQAS